MERTLDLTHLLNEDCVNTTHDNINHLFYEFGPEWNYSFNVNDSGLSLTIKETV